jgi:pyrroloquinoline quinone biosynthesis protein D
VTPARALATAESQPYLPRHVRVQFDPIRQRTAVLAPERVYWPDETAVEILKLCDGARPISEISGRLAKEYAAPLETIQADVLEFVQSWTDLKLLRLSSA